MNPHLNTRLFKMKQKAFINKKRICQEEVKFKDAFLVFSHLILLLSCSPAPAWLFVTKFVPLLNNFTSTLSLDHLVIMLSLQSMITRYLT